MTHEAFSHAETITPPRHNDDGTHTLGRFTFPNLESPNCHEAAQRWRPVVVRRALHSKVLVVATTRIEGAWAAYCLPVAGRNHDDEATAWRTDGSKVSERVARALFFEFENLPYAI